MLDPNCTTENWITFCYHLVQELLDSGDDLRRRSSTQIVAYKRSNIKPLKRPRPGSDDVLEYGLRCKGGGSIASIKFLPAAFRGRKCVFCGRRKACYKCRSCKMHLCMQTPRTSENSIRFPINGPPCYLRYHGVNNYT